MLIVRIIVGIIGATVGGLMVWRPQAFLEMIGEQAWMEKIFAGGAISGYKFLGVIIIIVSFSIMTGLIEGALLWFFGPVIGGL